MCKRVPWKNTTASHRKASTFLFGRTRKAFFCALCVEARSSLHLLTILTVLPPFRCALVALSSVLMIPGRPLGMPLRASLTTGIGGVSTLFSQDAPAKRHWKSLRPTFAKSGTSWHLTWYRCVSMTTHNKAIKVVPGRWPYTGRPCQAAAYCWR